MGLDLVVTGGAARSVASIADLLTAADIPVTIVMVDGALVAPGKLEVAAWRDLRLRTPEGMMTLLRRGDDLQIVVFGNASAPLRALQERVAGALAL